VVLSCEWCAELNKGPPSQHWTGPSLGSLAQVAPWVGSAGLDAAFYPADSSPQSVAARVVRCDRLKTYTDSGVPDVGTSRKPQLPPGLSDLLVVASRDLIEIPEDW
jgi:hypothetical protein